MHSTILSGAAIPIWDRALVAAVNAVSCGPGADPARLRIAVVNEQGAVYREIFGRDFTEHAQLLRCLAGHGFAVQSGVHGVHRLAHDGAGLEHLATTGLAYADCSDATRLRDIRGGLVPANDAAVEAQPSAPLVDQGCWGLVMVSR